MDLALLNIFINDRDVGIKCTFSRFADETKLSADVDTAENAIHRDFDKLGNWALVNIVKFNKAKCKILHLDSGSPRYVCKLGK